MARKPPRHQPPIEPVVLPPTEEQKAHEAQEVRFLMAKDTVKEAWAATERRITNEWKRATTPHERENCWAKIQIFSAFQQELFALAGRKYLHNGKE